MGALVGELCGVLYRQLRPKLIHEHSMEVLCELVQIVQNEVVEDQIRPQVRTRGRRAGFRTHARTHAHTHAPPPFRSASPGQDTNGPAGRVFYPYPYPYPYPHPHPHAHAHPQSVAVPAVGLLEPVLARLVQDAQERLIHCAQVGGGRGRTAGACAASPCAALPYPLPDPIPCARPFPTLPQTLPQTLP
jgi:hypothetical protein